MDKPEKLATRRRKTKQKHNTICVRHHYTQDTRQRQTKQKHNTICVGHHYAQTNTNSVNKTCALLRKLSVVYMSECMIVG